MNRPACVINIDELPGEKRPRFTQAEGVGAVVSSPGNTTGLTRMGVHLRTVVPGMAGTNRHFHTVEEEWTYVLSGEGIVRIGPLRIPVRAGSFVGFPPGPRPHHFLAGGNEPLVMLEGGERRRSEDDGWYPDAHRMWRRGEIVEGYEEPPAEEGDEAQVVHVDDVESVQFQHDVDSGARREMRTLHSPTGLVRQAVRWARVQAGTGSTAFHTHERTDEWVLILSGRAEARSGDDRFEVGPGDFLGHPAGAPSHRLEAIDDLTYLMGGQIDADDVVIYPEAGLERVGGRLRPLERR